MKKENPRNSAAEGAFCRGGLEEVLPVLEEHSSSECVVQQVEGLEKDDRWPEQEHACHFAN